MCSHADINTHLLSWQANWLLMFLCKHHSTPEGHGINVHSVLTPRTAASSSTYSGLTFIHIYAHVLCTSHFLLLCCLSSFHRDTQILYILVHIHFLLLTISHSQASQSFLWFPCCTLPCRRSIYNHRFWGLYLLPLQCYNHSYQSLATCVTALLCLLPVGFHGMTILWRWSSMTTWTSSAPITQRVRYHYWMLSVTCSIWWSVRTTKPASPSHMTKCAGSVVIHLRLMPLRSSPKSSSVLPRLLWERSSAKEKATIISVSMTTVSCVM